MDAKKVKYYLVSNKANIREAIKRMDKGGIGFIVCVDGNENVVGVVTDGDFRRAILQGTDLQNKISEIANKNYYYLKSKYEDREAEDIYKNTGVRHIPILENGKLIDILTKDRFYRVKRNKISEKPQLNLPVVIMAGGKGTRLDPFTRILPKALIPIGEKPIIEIIMDRFEQYGMKDFYLSLRHKSTMIKAYFEENGKRFKISYIDEDKPLGTIGSLRFLENKLKSPFFVSNCDIIIKEDYTKIYEFHKKKKYDLTIVASMQHHRIPYGVCKIENGGMLKEFTEKPEYDFLVNTGFYVLNPDILEFIPENKYFDMTNFMKILKQKNRMIGVFPVLEKSWIDVGEWIKYKETLKKFENDAIK